MARGPAGASGPPLGVVIESPDGSHTMWNGKQWIPATQGDDGQWAVDAQKMTAMGLSGQVGPLTNDDQKTVSDMATAARTMDNVSRTASDFRQRNAGTVTGGALAIPGASVVAKALGANGDDLATMDRDSVNMATGLRAPGMRITQMEFQKFLGSSPSVTNSEGNNNKAVGALNIANVMAQAQASFYSSYLQAHRTLAGVIPAWLGWRGQHFGDDGSYSHDPIAHQQAAGAALKSVTGQGAQQQVLKPWGGND
jgi:hypothetical protein